MKKRIERKRNARTPKVCKNREAYFKAQKKEYNRPILTKQCE